MKKILILIPVIFLFIAGCSKKEEQTNTNTNNNTTQPPVQQTPVPTQTEKKQDTVKTPDEKKETGKKEQTANSNATRVTFAAGETQVILDGKKSSFNDKRVYVFSAKKGQVLLTRVMSKDTKANIRIGKIISPSGKEEGPFDIKIKYELEETGDWKIELGEYKNPGEPWKGDYQLLVSVN